MKNLKSLLLLIGLFPLISLKNPTLPTSNIPVSPTKNLIVVTTDGLRWQELFNGADSILINSPTSTGDTALIKSQFWGKNIEERRSKLAPFIWSFWAKNGQLYGNRNLNNNVNVANIYAISYPGYNEMLTGNPDPTIFSNSKKYNSNENVLNTIAENPGFSGKVAAFASWELFPFILNNKTAKFYLNAGYSNLENKNKQFEANFNSTQNYLSNEEVHTRQDELTYLAAKNYLINEKPRVLFMGLGETDEFAHQFKYGDYLQQIAKVDKMLAELWYLIQTTPGYKDNTTIIFTTDHGRGSYYKRWGIHGPGVKGSSEIFLGLLGPTVKPLGEIKNPGQIFQKQIAGAIASYVGLNFKTKEQK